MASAIVIFFSVGGTTRAVGERIAAGLEESGVEVVLHDLRDGIPTDIAEYDLIGVGSPTHYYRLPDPVRTALSNIGQQPGHATFGFVLNGSYRGAALNELRRGLMECTTTELGTFTTRGEGHHILYLREGCLTSPGRPNEADLAEATDFGRTLARRLEAHLSGAPAPAPTPMDRPTHWVYALERLVTLPLIAKAVYSRLFRADRRACTRCGRCARVCPTTNIRFERGAIPTWGRDCITCGTCVAECPADAVRSPLDWWVFRPFARYNVRRIMRDHDIEYVRVSHKGGKSRIVEPPAPTRP